MPRPPYLEIANQKKNQRYAQAMALGFMHRYPGRLRQGETRITVALEALRGLRDEDRRMQELIAKDPGAAELLDESNADKLSRALGRSIDVVEEELSQDYRAVDEHGRRMPKREFQQLPERKLQMQVAMDVIKVSARIASERLKTQRADVLAGLLAEMKARDMVPDDPMIPPTVGFGEDE